LGRDPREALRKTDLSRPRASGRGPKGISIVNEHSAPRQRGHLCIRTLPLDRLKPPKLAGLADPALARALRGIPPAQREATGGQRYSGPLRAGPPSSMPHYRSCGRHYGSSVPHNGRSMPHYGRSMPHNRRSVPYNGSSMPHNGRSMPHNESPVPYYGRSMRHYGTSGRHYRSFRSDAPSFRSVSRSLVVCHGAPKRPPGGSFVPQRTAAKGPGKTAAPPVLSPGSAAPSAEPQPSPAVAQGPPGRAQDTCCKGFRGRGTSRGGPVHPPRTSSRSPRTPRPQASKPWPIPGPEKGDAGPL
jgi:hypothetical protein